MPFLPRSLPGLTDHSEGKPADFQPEKCKAHSGLLYCPTAIYRQDLPGNK
jgi:hypothetical protein